MSLGSKSHISSKIVIIILVMSITSTTIAFLALFLCYVRQRKRPHPIQSPINSLSDKETSHINTSKFISRKTSFVPEKRGVMNSPISHITSKTAIEFTISSLLVKSYLVYAVEFYTLFLFFISFFRMLSKSIYFAWEPKRNISWKYYSILIC